MIKKIVRYITGDKFIKLKDLNKIDFNRIADFEPIEWKVSVNHNGGIFKRDWLKAIDNEAKGFKKTSKSKQKKVNISSRDYEIISKIVETEYIFMIVPAKDKIGRLSRVDKILLNNLSEQTKVEILKTRLNPRSIDEVEYIHLLVFLDNVSIN